MDIIVKSHNEQALTSSIEPRSTLRALKKWIEDDHRDQSCSKFDKQCNLRESFSYCVGKDQDDLQCD